MHLANILRILSVLLWVALAIAPGEAAVPQVAGVARSSGSVVTALTAVYSRKVHGAAGTFDLPVDWTKPIGGTISIEPRAAGAAHALVFRFDAPVGTPGTLGIFDDANAPVAGGIATVTAANEVTVTLPTLPDRSRVRATLTNVGGSGLNVSAAIGFLLGDTTGQALVSAASVTAMKARAGQVTDTGNLRYDINLSGAVSAADIAATKARNGIPLLPLPGAAWPGFARDAAHNANSPVASQTLSRLRWNTPVDLAPQYTGGTYLLAHYGPPVITARHTLVLPVKTGAAGGYRIEARAGVNGALVWSQATDYILPAHFWVPSVNVVLTAANRVYIPGAGGKLYFRDNADSSGEATQTLVFYGAGNYAAAASTYDSTVFINTPLTADAQGNIYFGYSVTGANPINLTSGVARVTPAGVVTTADTAALMSSAFARPVLNAAPALSPDQSTLYVPIGTSSTLNGTPTPHLVAFDSTTLAKKSSVMLMDPASGQNAIASENGTSSPMVGPDGDVYYGVLGSSGGAHSQTGWLLHFDATLAITRIPGAFGWDNTPSLVPVSMVPSYSGGAAYLLMTKYNSYVDGQHRIAILDPTQSQFDTSSGALVMNEIRTKRSPTPDPNNAARVTEWCINTAAVDPATGTVLVNNEDGFLYRWKLDTNQLTESIRLTSGIGQAYTATVIGPDGVVYAVNNAVLFSVGQ